MTSSTTVHSSVASASASSGSSHSPGTILMSLNLSGPLRAKRMAASGWSSPRMLTAKWRAAPIARPVEDCRFRQTSSIGGSSESDDTALAVVP